MYQTEAKENINFNFVKNNLEKIFASRCKAITEKSLSVWINDIINCKFDNNAILQAVDEFLNSEDIVLSLPSIKNLCRKYQAPVMRPTINCPYCNGKGYVLGIKFNTKGELEPQTYTALGCVCGNNRDKTLLTMNEDKNSHHKTIVNDGFYLIFKDVLEAFSIEDMAIDIQHSWLIVKGIMEE